MKNFTQLGWIRFPSELNFPGVFSKVDDIYFGVPYRQYLNDRYDPIFVQIFLQLLRSTSYHYFIKAILNSSISRNFSF